jgi:ABC-2 type transport system permease protein
MNFFKNIRPFFKSVKFFKYFNIWFLTTKLSFQTYLISRKASVIYLTGKFLRFSIFIFLLRVVVPGSRNLAGYSFEDLFNFFLVFNLLDILGQLFFRGIYWFKNKVVTGAFDFNLVKPLNPLFQILTPQTDFLDLPLLVVVLFLLVKNNLSISLTDLFYFSILFLASFLFVISIHILVASIGVVTTEVDHAIWIFRDFSHMARVPVDIYIDSIRAFLTFVVPVGLIFTFPAKALMGLLSFKIVVFISLASSLFFSLALFLWRQALKKYTSASS